MRAMAWTMWLALSATLALPASAAETNYLTLGAGAVVVRAAPEAERAGIVALDGSGQTVGVGIPRREPLPLSFVVELPAPTTFSRFEMPAFNEFGSARGRHVRTVRIEGSSVSPDEGFGLLLEASLESGQRASQRFEVAEARPVRWVRVTLVDRLEPPPRDIDPHLFTELEGYGTQEAVRPAAGAFTGRWRYRRKGINDDPGVNVVDLRQDGTAISGCERMGGRQVRISGDVVDGLARLVGEDEQGNRQPFTAVVTRSGQLAGVKFAGPPRPFYAAPAPDAEAPCPPPRVANPIEDALGAGHTAVVYGIHFDVDSDVLRPDAGPALEALLAALNALPTLAVTVEGHTDSDASDAHNLDLSQRRAAAVVRWLVERSVAPGRLTPVGKGEGEPIADNDTSSGRALNRRVEIEPRR
ncbi:MAG: OmpA family protein [Deltaproteobacteria bacterium]|nr:OmpA family protein [Deltaproteobacteria bacterium]